MQKKHPLDIVLIRDHSDNVVYFFPVDFNPYLN